MDIVKQKQIREWTLLGLVGTMALVANLPHHFLSGIGVDPGLLMTILGVMVILALFLYVRFFFFLLYALLTLGANLPDKWAESLGISQTPLLATLVIMVAISLYNYSSKILPSGLEPKKRKQNPEATKVLLHSIERGNLPYVTTLLTMDFDLNTFDDEGLTPLMRAAQYGHLKMVQAMLKRDASPSLAGPLGRASDIALQNNFPAVSECLRVAEEEDVAKASQRTATQQQAESVVIA